MADDAVGADRRGDFADRGLFVSAAADRERGGYQKHIEEKRRKAEREATKDAERLASEYVGQIGKRIDVDVTDMQLVTSWENQWGYTYLYKFTDINGNVLIWFASGIFGYWTKDGEWVQHENINKIRATVKEHTERDGVKQTVITRCKAG